MASKQHQKQQERPVVDRVDAPVPSAPVPGTTPASAPTSTLVEAAGDEPAACPICGQQFRVLANLASHMADPDMHLRCPGCQREFGSLKEIAAHRVCNNCERAAREEQIVVGGGCDSCGQGRFVCRSAAEGDHAGGNAGDHTLVN